MLSTELKGVDEMHKMLLNSLPQGTDMDIVQIEPQVFDENFLQLQKDFGIRTCIAHSVPPSLIGISDKSSSLGSGKEAEEYSKSFWKNIAEERRRFEYWFNTNIVRGIWGIDNLIVGIASWLFW